MKFLKKSDIILLIRRGYFGLDKIDSCNKKITPNFIPDVKQKIWVKSRVCLVSGWNTGVKTKALIDAAKDKKKN